MVVFLLVLLCFFVFKQKTAYEMRISDWSSYVCSSDLGDRRRGRDAGADVGVAAGRWADHGAARRQDRGGNHAAAGCPAGGSGRAIRDRRAAGQFLERTALIGRGQEPG